MLTAIVLAVCFTVVSGHGAMVTPKPRNAIDGALPINDKGGEWVPKSSCGELLLTFATEGCQNSVPGMAGFCYPCNCGSYAPYTDPETGIVGAWDPLCDPGLRSSMNGQSW
jgi:hypothetical protein